MTVGHALLAVFLICHLFLLLPFLASKPSYSDAVLAYLALYPFFYMAYAVVNAARDLGSGGSQERAESIAALSPAFALMWVTHVIRVAEWWRDPVIWATYSSLASLPLLMLYLLRPYTRINCGKLADALAPLVIFHLAYGLATMFIDVVAGVDLYRLLLWYFAIYPTSLAAAGGGRLAMLAATAIYLAAYALGAEPLLLLLAAVPAVKRWHIRL